MATKALKNVCQACRGVICDICGGCTTCGECLCRSEKDYKAKYEGAYKFIRGRIKVLRPRSRDFKEIHLLIVLARCMGAEDLKAQLVEMYHEHLENEKKKKVRAVENLGYEVRA